uniref:GSKIP_dom domain-containing protein n=1 Tax=Panagrellus redivivus TaxID=6233 RepID=A0A7E4ZPU2_PANRE
MDNRKSSDASDEGLCETCGAMSQLEIESFAAVKEVAPFVKSISLSEVLSRTPDLIFTNLHTLEGQTYCIELTQRGWRICSDRADSMNGDFRKLELHSRYFETIYQLLDIVSPLYRDRYAQALADKLKELEGHKSYEESVLKSTVAESEAPPTTDKQ